MAHYVYGKGLKGQGRKRHVRRMQKIVLAGVILVLLFAIAGAIYTWWMGRHAKPETGNSISSRQAKPLPKPMSSDPNAPVGVYIQTMNSPVTSGDNVVLGVHTTPGATCVIKVEYNKVPVKDSGIVDKVADDYGVAMWSWTIPADAPVGKWPVDITCSYGKQSGYMHGDLEIKAKEL